MIFDLFYNFFFLILSNSIRIHQHKNETLWWSLHSFPFKKHKTFSLPIFLLAIDFILGISILFFWFTVNHALRRRLQQQLKASFSHLVGSEIGSEVGWRPTPGHRIFSLGPSYWEKLCQRIFIKANFRAETQPFNMPPLQQYNFYSN